MLIVVSPAKALDFESPLPTRKFSEPEMLDRSRELVSIMRGKSPDELSSMMSISSQLGELNFERFHDWTTPFTPDNARPAVLAFNGDTYVGLDAPATFGERDYTHAQKVLRILSGLHGVLRPLDLIQPYRLEMGSKIQHDRGDDLYSFWDGDVTDRLNADLAAAPGAKVLVNLASIEYFSVVQPERVDARIISPKFLDARGDGEHRVVAFFAKRARGAMAGWIIRERISSARALTGFDGLGYRYDEDRSNARRAGVHPTRGGLTGGRIRVAEPPRPRRNWLKKRDEPAARHRACPADRAAASDRAGPAHRARGRLAPEALGATLAAESGVATCLLHPGHAAGARHRAAAAGTTTEPTGTRDLTAAPVGHGAGAASRSNHRRGTADGGSATDRCSTGGRRRCRLAGHLRRARMGRVRLVVEGRHHQRRLVVADEHPTVGVAVHEARHDDLGRREQCEPVEGRDAVGVALDETPHALADRGRQLVLHRLEPVVDDELAVAEPVERHDEPGRSVEARLGSHHVDDHDVAPPPHHKGVDDVALALHVDRMPDAVEPIPQHRLAAHRLDHHRGARVDRAPHSHRSVTRVGEHVDEREVVDHVLLVGQCTLAGGHQQHHDEDRDRDHRHDQHSPEDRLVHATTVPHPARRGV